jgi:hypothetical protein
MAMTFLPVAFTATAIKLLFGGKMPADGTGAARQSRKDLGTSRWQLAAKLHYFAVCGEGGRGAADGHSLW